MQEDSLEEHLYDVLKVLAEMREQAEEDRYDQRKNLSFIRHGIAQKAVAQVIFYDPDELSLLQEGRFGLLKDCKDELKADNLRTNHVVAD